MSYLSININSLCIPRVFTNITELQIRKIFEELELGQIERIDIVPKFYSNGDQFNRVFIHIQKWFNNQNAIHAQERLSLGMEIKVIYDDPWFWKVSAYKKQLKQNKNK
jgi:hypothetical protein